MKKVRAMTQAELAAYVQTELAKREIEVVLSGGACVAIYSKGRYVSMDLDLINTYAVPRRDLRQAMKELGFREEGRYFRHPESRFIIEFPPGPLMVGDEPVRRVNRRRLDTGTLKLLSATDCAKDRLAAYYFWGDLQSLEQAELVCQGARVDLKELARWSKSEMKVDEFRKIRPRLVRKKR